MGQTGEVEDILRRVMAGERIAHYETVRRTKDGRTIEVSLTVSPVRDDGGEIREASVIARDVIAGGGCSARSRSWPPTASGSSRRP
jgi:PAS domain S-box-containing protein